MRCEPLVGRVPGWPLVLALALLSCAGPAQLARMSERELRAGHVRRAYELARHGLNKSPENLPARTAMTAAATQLADDWKSRILELAEVDTVAAARYAREFGDFRAEVARNQVELPADPEFLEREGRILTAAAGAYYRLAEESLAARRPKEAYERFQTARAFAPGYGDVERRLRETYDLARSRVAILPFVNQTEVPGLSLELGDRITSAVARRVGSSPFRFTELVGRDAVASVVTVAQLGALSREQAYDLGKTLGADRVVSGRFYALRSSSVSDAHHQSIYHKVTDRDTAGVRRERYVESELEVVTRERRVQVRYDLEVLDVRERTVLASRSEPLEAVARVIWTDYRVDGDCKDYCLVPPETKKADPDRARRIEEQWSARSGSWTLAELLEGARKDTQRARYRSSYRNEFDRDPSRRPILLGELPGENDLAFVALDEVWRPVLDVIRELDPED